MITKLEKALMLLTFVTLFFTLTYLAYGEETLSVYLNHVDDGGCSVAARTVQVSYLRTGDGLEASADVLTAPNGGNCETRSTAYGVELEVPYSMGEWDAIAKFVADERPAGATYVLTDGMGTVLTRGDGGALFPTQLPVLVKNVGAIIGVSRSFGNVEIDLGANAVPVDWSDGDNGHTVHMGLSAQAGDFGFRASMDAGADLFGDVGVTWSRGIATCRADYVFGLDTLDAGVPGTQSVRDAIFALAGPPKGTRTSAGCGLTWAIE